jgi:hypothetical protein
MRRASLQLAARLSIFEPSTCDDETPRRNLCCIDVGCVVGCSDDDQARVNSANGTADAGVADTGNADAGTDGGTTVDSGDAAPDMAIAEPLIECEPGDEIGEARRGIGTIEDPIVICSETQLLAMVPELGWYHVLGRDIDLSTTYTESPISGEFYGDLNGQGFAIRGLTIEATSGRVGLFENFYGSVESLRLLDVSVVADSDSVGALAATMTRSDATDIVIEGTVTGRNQVGGMAGRTSDTNRLEGLRFSGALTGATEKVGGLFGQLSSVRLRDVVVEADVLSTGREVGGVIGDARSGGEMEDVHFEGTVAGDLLVGGIAGVASYPQYSRVSARGTIRTGGQSGGFIGSLTDPRNSFPADIEDSYAAVDFEPQSGIDEMHLVGGFVGNWGSVVSSQARTADDVRFRARRHHEVSYRNAIRRCRDNVLAEGEERL